MDDVTGIIAIMMVFSIPLAAIMAGPFKEWLAQRERRETRQMIERMAKEKLDIIKTAVAMGMAGEDLADLDDRLERAIGTEKMQSLLATKPGKNSSEPAKVSKKKSQAADPLREQMTTAEIDAIYGSSARRAERQ